MKAWNTGKFQNDTELCRDGDDEFLCMRKNTACDRGQAE